MHSLAYLCSIYLQIFENSQYLKIVHAYLSSLQNQFYKLEDATLNKRSKSKSIFFVPVFQNKVPRFNRQADRLVLYQISVNVNSCQEKVGCWQTADSC